MTAVALLRKPPGPIDIARTSSLACLRRGHLSLLLRPGSSCDFHRVQMPYTLIDIAPKVPVVVFNRIASCGIEQLRVLQSQGTKVVMDMDDHFLLGPDHHLAALYAKHGMSAQIEAFLRMADLVTVTTARLADALQPLAKRIEIIPNALPFDEGMFCLSDDKDSGRPFVFFGGSGHRRDLQMLRESVDVRNLTLAGAVRGQGMASGEWSKISALYKGAKIKNYIGLPQIGAFIAGRHEWAVEQLPVDRHAASWRHAGDHPDYLSLLDGHRAVLAPLLSNRFNACKSNLKALEAGAKGLPLIASQVAPYWNAVDKDVVLFASTPDEWRTHQRRILDDGAFAEDRGAALAEHVRKHYHLNKVNELRRQILEDL